MTGVFDERWVRGKVTVSAAGLGTARERFLEAYTWPA